MEDLHKLWKHRWLTPKAKVSKSTIFAFGIFAVSDIANGEIIRITGGIIVPKNDIEKYHEKMDGVEVEIQIDNDFFLAPSKKDEAKETGLFNHSCGPNVGFLDTIKVIAIRDIKSGEELTMDYAFFGGAFKTFKCKCASVNCRKVITPDDWKNPELQKKYGEYFSPYLKKKFA